MNGFKTSNAIILDCEKGYRIKNIYVGNQFEKVYIPSDFKMVPNLMDEYCQSINCFDNASISDKIVKITKDHIMFEKIHPFQDGNGRTGRLVMNQQLINNGFLPICITKNSKYSQSFRAYDKNNDYSLMEHIICSEIQNTLIIAEELLNKGV